MHSWMSVCTLHSVHMYDQCTKVYICVHISTDTSKEYTCQYAVILKSKPDKTSLRKFWYRFCFDPRESYSIWENLPNTKGIL